MRSKRSEATRVLSIGCVVRLRTLHPTLGAGASAVFVTGTLDFWSEDQFQRLLRAAPDDGPLDFEHLSRMTLGDPALECEVLTMFVAQSAKLLDQLMALPPEAGALAHTLKGSSRAIGAFAVAEAAARLETTLAGQGDARAMLDGLRDAVAQAQGAIEAFLSRG